MVWGGGPVARGLGGKYLEAGAHGWNAAACVTADNGRLWVRL